MPWYINSLNHCSKKNIFGALDNPVLEEKTVFQVG